MTTDLRRLAYAAGAIAAAIATVVAVVLATAPTSVFAAEVPVPIAVSDTSTYRGELSDARDVDLFSVRLEAGGDYVRGGGGGRLGERALPARGDVSRAAALAARHVRSSAVSASASMRACARREGRLRPVRQR